MAAEELYRIIKHHSTRKGNTAPDEEELSVVNATILMIEFARSIQIPLDLSNDNFFGKRDCKLLEALF